MNNHKTFFAFLMLMGTGVLLSLLLYNANEQNNSGVKRSCPQRVICMTPAITELVFALECDNIVVGVSDFCTYPPEALEKENLGGFFNPNFERLMALKPDLIIIQGRFEKMMDFCRQKHLTLLSLELNDLETIYREIMLLGKTLKRTEQAQRLCTQIQQSLEKIEVKVTRCKKRRVFFSLSRTSGLMTGLTTVEGKSFLSELIAIAGGKNIFDDIEQSYPQVSKEALLKRAPEIIIEALPGEQLSSRKRQQLTADWKIMANLPAVRKEQIRFLTEDYILIPGPRMGQAAEKLAKAIHPEVFCE